MILLRAPTSCCRIASTRLTLSSMTIASPTRGSTRDGRFRRAAAIDLPNSLHRSRLRRRPRARRRRSRHARRARRAIGDDAARLPRYGVTAFCPTTIACAPAALRRMLAGVRAARTRGSPAARGSCRRTSRATSSSRTSAAPSRSTASDCRRRLRARSARGRGRVLDGPTSSLRLPRRARTWASSRSRPRSRRARADSRSRRARSSRVARTFGRELRGGAGGHSRRRAAGDAPLQPHDADDASRAGTGRRDPRDRRVIAELICDGVHVHPA